MLTFTRLAPVLYVYDLESEVAFYMSFGFRILHQGDELPDFVALQEGDVQFGIQVRGDFDSDEANRALLWQFQVSDLAEAVTICETHGYRYRSPKKYWEKADGWEMQVWSPAGYKINLKGQAPTGA